MFLKIDFFDPVNIRINACMIDQLGTFSMKEI